jgi:hypothetical protein
MVAQWCLRKRMGSELKLGFYFENRERNEMYVKTGQINK